MVHANQTVTASNCITTDREPSGSTSESTWSSRPNRSTQRNPLAITPAAAIGPGYPTAPRGAHFGRLFGLLFVFVAGSLDSRDAR
jgi:hypothetical protein